MEGEPNQRQQSTKQQQSSHREVNSIRTKRFAKVSEATKNLHLAEMYQTEPQIKLKELKTSTHFTT